MAHELGMISCEDCPGQVGCDLLQHRQLSNGPVQRVGRQRRRLRRRQRRWRRRKHDARAVVRSGKAVKVTRLGRHAADYHVDASVVGGHVGVRREVLGRGNSAPLYACDAPDTHGRNRVVVERVGIAAAVVLVRAAAVVGVGIWDVVSRGAVRAARKGGNATLEHSCGRVEVGRRSVGAPVDGEGAARVILIRNRQIVGRPGVGATKDGVDALISGPEAVVFPRISPVVGRSRVPAPVTY